MNCSVLVVSILLFLTFLPYDVRSLPCNNGHNQKDVICNAIAKATDEYAADNFTLAFQHLLEAHRLALTTGSRGQQTRTALHLARFFRKSALYYESERYLTQAGSTIKKIQDDNEKLFYNTLLLHEKAHLNAADSATERIIEDLLKAKQMIQRIQIDRSTRRRLYRQNDLCLSAYLLKQNNFKTADSLLLAAAANRRDADCLPQRLSLFFLQTQSALKQNKISAARQLLAQAKLLIPQKSQFQLEHQQYLKYQYQYYKLAGDKYNILRCARDYQRILEKRTIIARDISNFIMRFIEIKHNEQRHSQHRVYLLAAGIIGALVLFIVYTIMAARQDKQDLSIYSLTQKTENASLNERAAAKIPKDKNSPKNSGISKRKQKDIREALKEMASQDFFIRKDISLNMLAQHLQTNPRYISNVISQDHQVDFNTYIQQHRIQYIVLKLQNEPTFRRYKISYLAEISGFSTHSRFSQVFKKIMGISPSIFIEKLHTLHHDNEDTSSDTRIDDSS